MQVRRCMRWVVAATWLTAAQTVLMPILRAQAAPAAASAPAAAAPAPPAPPSVCGSTPNCAESNDFAAMITNFRTSDLRGYKMLDVIVRFRNKTANPLVLGYVQGSGGAVDEKGNRYSVFGANGVRGIGLVNGNSFDPKFTLPPGGVGDAQFELAWYPGQEIYGFTFMLDLTVDEINSYQGNQHSLGGEFPFHFEGLTNGVSSGPALAAGAVPGAAPSGSPCNKGGVGGTAMNVASATGSGAAQNAAGQATSTVATAATAVSGITSLFHHKKGPPPAANAQTVDPCASATTSSPGPAVATATSAGAIASKNPTSTPIRPGPTGAKTTSVAATPVVAKAPVTTPTVATTRTATTVKPVVATTPAKKDTTVVRRKP